MANILLEDFSNTCRACSCKTQSFQQLNANISNEHTWQLHEMLQLLIPQLSVQLNDALPQQICELCVNKLEMIYQFQQMCINSEQEFHQILQENVVKATDAMLVIKQEQPEFIDMEIELEEQSMHIKLEVEEEDEKATEQQMIVHALPRRNVKSCVEKSKQFACAECGKLFNRKSHVQRHQKLHSMERPFACDICSCRFTSTSHLTGHFNAEHGDNNKRRAKRLKTDGYECAECDLCFKKPESLAAHSNVHRKTWQQHGKLVEECEYCYQKFTTLARMKAHMYAKHAEKVTVYACTQCNKTFASEALLKEHSDLHKPKNVHRKYNKHQC